MKNQIFALLSIIFISLSCTSKKDNSALLDASKDQELLDRYFMAATAGMISTSDELKYVFKEPLTTQISDEVIQKVITLTPAAEGKITLSNNTILTFTPSVPLKSGQTYNVSLSLKSIDNKKFDNIEYQIKTFAQDMRVEREGIILNDDGSVSMLVGVKTADKMNPIQLKSCFKTDASTIEIAERIPNDYLVDLKYKNGFGKQSVINWDGKEAGADVKGEIALFDFNPAVFDVIHSFHNIADKTFNIYFSQKLNKQADLTGLLKVQNDNTSYNIKGNLLTIFLGEIRNVDIANITLSKNIRSEKGKTLVSDQSFEISLAFDKPDAQFVSDGNYFPSEGDFKIPVKTRALKSLRIVVIEIKQENVNHYLAWQSLTYADYYNLRMYGKPVYDQVVSLNEGLNDNEGWTVHGIDLTQRIRKNPGSIYHISLDFGPENTTIPCGTELKKYKINSRIPANEFFTIRDNYYEDSYVYYEDYKWEENGNPCKLAYYMNREPIHRIFICSDFSVVAKKAGDSYYIALSKLLDLSSVGGADLSLYSLQAEKMASAITSLDGFAEFHNIRDEAAVLKISKSNQVTYLVLDANQSNTLTEFDIAGERSETETEFYAYTDRDVWRPGDSIYVDLMINKMNSNLPAGMPIVMTFYNPENMITSEQIQQINLDNKLIYNFTLSTSPSAKTGVYRCIFRIGPKLVRKNIRIETIKPNTAEVIYSFAKMEENTIYDDKISGTINAKYLTGFDLANAKVKATGRGRKISQPFGDYKDYIFDVMDNHIMDNNFDVLDLQTNDKGSAAFTGKQEFKSYNSPISVSIETETILPGGGTNKEGKTILISPFETYLGAKRKEGSGWNGNHTFAENIEVTLINLTNKGKVNTAPNTVNYQIQRHIESWWVDKYRLRSSGNFVNSEFWQDVDNGSTSITGKSKITLPKGSLSKGAYKMTMTDESSGHKTQTYFTVYDGLESIPGAQPYIVEFQTDKDTYKAGETVKVMMPDIEGAKVLVSVERGNRIISQSWHILAKNNNILQLKSNEEWSPNVYIHATIMQKYKQESNDLPLRLYGIRHIKMDGSVPSLKPVVSIPDNLESGKTYNFTVAESQGRPLEYTLSLVDEGLLNLTGFATPDPAKHFNGKFPLLVKTWDIYQYLINYFKGKFAGIISIGGDDAYNPDAIAEINRFKPLSIHQGSFKIFKGGKNPHTITIPNYIGKVRLMISATSGDNFGKFEKSIPVKNPLMVQSQFPRTLNVSDKFQLPVTIFKDDPNIKTADLTAKADPKMVKGFNASKSITFNGKNQISNMFDLEVLNKTGKLNVELGVSGGGKSMKESTDILINYPNSYESSDTKNIVESGSKISVIIKPKGYEEVFTSTVMISGLKVPNFTQYVADLVTYPYGCLEQTTSSGFGQLYLDKIIPLDPKENKERLENLQAAINKISRFQQSSGKFNYWDGTYYHAWSDIYAGNFMIEMKRLGYLNNNSDMLTRWMEVHNSTANNWSISETTSDYVYESETLAQAFRLFVLAKGGKPAKSAMNRFVTSNKSKNPIAWWLLAGSFQLSGYNSKAKEFIIKAESLQKNYDENRSYESFGDQGRDWAIIVEVLSYIDGEAKKLEAYYDQMVETLNKMSWTSTQTKGFAFVAAYKYFGKSLNISGQVQYSVTGLPGGVKSYQHSAFEPHVFNIEKSAYNKPLTIQNTGKGRLYIYQSDRFIDNNLNKEAASSNLGISVDFNNATRHTSGTDASIGDDLFINIRVSNPSALEINDLALNLKMPTGLEIINPRLYETEVTKTNGSITYQDFRDDRVYTFFKLKAGGSEIFTFKAKAAFTGDFYMPAVSCEHMYKGSVYARTESRRVGIGK
jgi:uncharacterized protein YfaS (alpha-2-macroglobulin family)